MAHRHTRSEVGIAQTFRSQALHQGTNDGVGTRVPSGSDDADGLRILIDRHQLSTVVEDACVDIEGIDGIDA